jgi:hypothetical protein
MNVTTETTRPQCDRIAIYGSPDGTLVRVPLPPDVVPMGFTSHYGKARFLVDVVMADDPRTDDQIALDAIRAMDGELLALAEDAA